MLVIWSWHTIEDKGILLDDTLVAKPGPEGADGAQVAAYRVRWQCARLGAGEGVSAEAFLLSQVEDEGLDVVVIDLGSVIREAVGDEEFLEMGQAWGDVFDGAGALCLGGGKELIAGGEGGYGVGVFAKAGTPLWQSVSFWGKIGTFLRE